MVKGIFLSGIISICLVACTSVHTFVPEHSSMAALFKVGDRVVVEDTSGEVFDFYITEIDDSYFAGQSAVSPFELVQVSFQSIQFIEQEKAGPMTSIGMAGALAVIVPFSALTGALGLEWE